MNHCTLLSVFCDMRIAKCFLGLNPLSLGSTFIVSLQGHLVPSIPTGCLKDHYWDPFYFLHAQPHWVKLCVHTTHTTTELVNSVLTVAYKWWYEQIYPHWRGGSVTYCRAAFSIAHMSGIVLKKTLCRVLCCFILLSRLYSWTLRLFRCAFILWAGHTKHLKFSSYFLLNDECRISPQLRESFQIIS